MAKCHFDQIQSNVPVGVITDLKNNILIANVAKTTNTNYAKTTGEWLVSGARAMITRFWASSSASIVIVPHMPSIYNTCPPLPKDITIEKEFCLWLGYIESIRRVTVDDLREGRLLKVFVGVIDNIKSTGSAKGGYTIQIQARDRIKWLMDSEVYYSVQEITKVYKTTIGNSDGMGVPRSLLIHDICRRAVGGPPQDTTDIGIDAEAYQSKKRIDLDDKETEDISLSSTSQVNPFKFYKIGDQPLASKLNTYALVEDNPKLRVITTRISIGGEYDKDYDPITKYAGLAFLLSGQVALDVIKSIAMQEVYPTEFFQDHRDGNFYYTPRTNDSSGLQDPERFYRTYFFRNPYKNTSTFNEITQNIVTPVATTSNINTNSGVSETISSPPTTSANEDVIYPGSDSTDLINNVPDGYVLKVYTVSSRTSGGRTSNRIYESFFVKTDSSLSNDELKAEAIKLYNDRLNSSTNTSSPSTPTNSTTNSSSTQNNPNILFRSQCQNLIAYREEFSSIGMKTNFLVSIASPMSSSVPHDDLVLHLSTNPYSLRDVDFAPKYHRISDPTIKTAEEAAIVALSAARIWGKETNVAMAVMLGDPSLVPGEVIQVIGSPILDEGGAKQINADREKYFEWEANSNQMIKDYSVFSSTTAKERAKDRTSYPEAPSGLEYIKQVEGKRGEYEAYGYDKSLAHIKVVNQEVNNTFSFLPWVENNRTGVQSDVDINENVEHLFSTEASILYGAENTSKSPDGPRGFEELPRTIYRIEAVSHKFNLGSPGMTTEVALVSPF